MYELKKVSDHDSYISSPANIGLFVRDNDAYLIDSGNDKDAGRRVRKILEENNLRLKAIFNTHSHADHIGGNRYLENNTGCLIYSSDAELGFIRNPILEPSFLYGANPQKELKNKFLYAEKSDAKMIEESVLPSGVKIIDLKGHSIGMIGFLTEEGTAYIADSISSERTLEKYKISYIYDVKAFLNTLDYLKTLDAKVYIPSHSDQTDDISSLIEINRKSVVEIANLILDIVKEEATFEDILSFVFSYYALNMNDNQYVLIGSTIKSYLTYLREEGLVEVLYSANKMIYRRK